MNRKIAVSIFAISVVACGSLPQTGGGGGSSNDESRTQEPATQESNGFPKPARTPMVAPTYDTNNIMYTWRAWWDERGERRDLSWRIKTGKIELNRNGSSLSGYYMYDTYDNRGNRVIRRSKAGGSIIGNHMSLDVGPVGNYELITDRQLGHGHKSYYGHFDVELQEGATEGYGTARMTEYFTPYDERGQVAGSTVLVADRTSRVELTKVGLDWFDPPSPPTYPSPSP